MKTTPNHPALPGYDAYQPLVLDSGAIFPPQGPSLDMMAALAARRCPICDTIDCDQCKVSK